METFRTSEISPEIPPVGLQPLLPHKSVSKFSMPQSMPLTDCEEFMVRDHYAGYPNVMHVRFRFAGRLNRDVYEEAVRRICERHPMTRARLNRRRGKFFWTISDAGYRLRPIQNRSEVDDYPNMPASDPSEEPGIKMFFVEDENSTDVTCQTHHAICDGLGGLQIFIDWLMIYSQLCEAPHKTPKLRRLDDEVLKERSDFGFGTWKYWKTIHQQAIGLAGVFEFLFRKPVEFVPKSLQDINSPPPAPYPRGITHEFSETESAKLQALASEGNATSNEMLVRDLFLAINQWRTKHKHRKESDRIRILIPMNMREFKHRRMSAANRISFVSIDRTPVDCRHPKKLLQTIRGQMNVIHSLNLGLVFPAMLRIISKIPGGLKRMTSANRCASTCMMTNLGDPLAKVKLPRQDGKFVVGNLVLEGMDGLAPLRPKTNVAFTLFRYTGKLCLSLNYDPRALSADEAREFMNMFVRRIQRTIESSQ